MRRKPVIRQPEITSGNEKVGSMQFMRDSSGNFVLKEMEKQEQSDRRNCAVSGQRTGAGYAVSLYVSDSLGRWIHGVAYSLWMRPSESGESQLWGHDFEPGNHYHIGPNGWEEETGRKGVLEITGLPKGSYILKEVRNPSGFVPDDSSYPFDLGISGNREFEIRKKSTILRIQMRAPSGSAVRGAVMKATGAFSDGNNVHTWVMTGGEYTLEGKLKTECTYLLSEISPPLGYELLRDPIQIRLDRKGKVSASSGKNNGNNTIIISCRRSRRGGG